MIGVFEALVSELVRVRLALSSSISSPQEYFLPH